LIIKFFIDALQNKKAILTIILAGVLFTTAIHGIKQYMYYGSPIHYCLAYQGNTDSKGKIKQNLKKIFNDKINYKYDIDGIWGVVYDDSAAPIILNVNDRLVHLEYGFKTGESEKSKKIYWENVLNNDIYVPLYASFKLDGKLSELEKCNFKVVEITDVLTDVTFLQGDSIIYIVKVEYSESFEGENKQIFQQLLDKRNEI